MEQPQVADDQRDLSRVPESLRGYCFKPGQSGNPNGRPKGSYSVVAPLREIMASESGALAQAIAEELVRRAFADEAPAALLELIERLDGKVEKQIRQTGEPTIVVINGPRSVAKPPASS